MRESEENTTGNHPEINAVRDDPSGDDASAELTGYAEYDSPLI